MTFETLQIGLYFFYSASLVRVTDYAARQIVTGQVATQGLTQAQFLNTVIQPQLPGNMSINNVILNVQTLDPTQSNVFYTTTNGSPSQEPTQVNPPVAMDNSKTTFCVGSGQSLVALQIYYAMPVLGIPALGLTNGATFNGQNVVWISSTATFENEPFGSSNTSC